MKTIRAISWVKIKSILQLAVIILIVINIPAGVLGLVYGQVLYSLQLGIFISAVLIIPICFIYLITMLLSRIDITNTEVAYRPAFFQIYGPQTAEISKIARIALEVKIEVTGLGISITATNFYSQAGDRLLSINPFLFDNKSLRDLLVTLQTIKPDITFNEYSLELVEKGSLQRFENKYFKKLLLIFIPIILLFLFPIFAALGSFFGKGELSEYQKILLPNLFLSVVPLSISTLCGIALYFFLVKDKKALKEWFTVGTLGLVTLFFIGVTSIFQWQVYNDWISQPVILVGAVRNLRVGLNTEPPNLLFKVSGNDHLWDVNVDEAYKDKNLVAQTDLYRKLSQTDAMIRIYYSPNYKVIIKIEDVKTGETILQTQLRL